MNIEQSVAYRCMQNMFVVEVKIVPLQGHIQSTSDRVQLNDLQSLLCATLQVCCALCLL